MSRVAVTAASGALGSTVARHLAVAGQDVVALARRPEAVPTLGRVQVRRGDYGDADGLRRALDDVDTLVLVSLNGPVAPRRDLHANVLSAAAAADVSKVVYTSVAGTTAEGPFGAVVASNRATERDLAASGMRWVVARNGLYVEPDLAVADQYAATGEIVNSAGDGRAGYTSRAQLAAAYVALVTTDAFDGRAVGLGGPPSTQAELAAAIGDATGRPISYRPVRPSAFLEDRVAALGKPAGEVVASLYAGVRAGDWDVDSDVEDVVGTPHPPLHELVAQLLASRA